MERLRHLTPVRRWRHERDWICSAAGKNGWEKLSEISKVWADTEDFSGDLILGYLPNAYSNYDVICCDIDINVTVTPHVSTSDDYPLEFYISPIEITKINRYWISNPSGGDQTATLSKKGRTFFGNLLSVAFLNNATVEVRTTRSGGTVWENAAYILSGSYVKIITYGKKNNLLGV